MTIALFQSTESKAFARFPKDIQALLQKFLDEYKHSLEKAIHENIEDVGFYYLLEESCTGILKEKLKLYPRIAHNFHLQDRDRDDGFKDIVHIWLIKHSKEIIDKMSKDEGSVNRINTIVTQQASILAEEIIKEYKLFDYIINQHPNGITEADLQKLRENIVEPATQMYETLGEEVRFVKAKEGEGKNGHWVDYIKASDWSKTASILEKLKDPHQPVTLKELEIVVHTVESNKPKPGTFSSNVLKTKYGADRLPAFKELGQALALQKMQQDPKCTEQDLSWHFNIFQNKVRIKE